MQDVRSTAEKSSTHRSAVLGGGDEYFMKSNRSASKSKAELSGSKTGKRGIFSEGQSSVPASDSVRDNSSIRQIPELTIYNVAAAVPQPNKYSSEIKLASNIEPEFQQDRSRTKKSRSDRQNEERRKKDGEKARDKQRERLVEEATEGGYTISNDEIEKRLDAYMRKREVIARSLDDYILFSNIISRKNIKRGKKREVPARRPPLATKQSRVSIDPNLPHILLH